MSATLLQRYSFDGTLEGEGSLNLALQNTETTLGTPTYAAGPFPETQAVVIPTFASYLRLPYNQSLDFTNTSSPSFSFGGWFYIQTVTTNSPMLLTNTTPTSVTGIELWHHTSVSADKVQNARNGSYLAIVGGTVNSTINRWVHRWVIFNENRWTIYSSGIETGNVAVSLLASGYRWSICEVARGPGIRDMTGRVADVRWYSGVVSPAVAMTQIVPEPELNIQGNIHYIADKLLANDPSASDFFGWTIAIDENTTVIGAYGWDRKAASGVTALDNCGCAYEYVNNGISWEFQQQLFANDPSAGNRFGISVSISKDTIVIGADQWSRKAASGVTAIANCGCAYVFIHNGIEWIQQKQLLANDPSTNDNFGLSAAISDDTIVISSSGWDRKVATDITALSACGCAYVFVRNNTDWILQQQLLANDPSGADIFGCSVALSKDTIVIGAYLWDRKVASGITAVDACGCAYVFIKNENEWIFQQQLVANDPSANDNFGWSVAISENTIVISAYGWDRKVASGITAVEGCGCAYVFVRNNTDWSLQQQILANDLSASDLFGYSVSISNNIIVIGASNWDRKVASNITALSNCGCAYVFVRNEIEWTQQKQVLANDPSVADQFGYTIAINNDTVVIGVRSWDRKAASGVTALTDCGSAYITDLGLYVAPVVVNKNYQFSFNWTEYKLISGNIGIGTSIPNKTLDINGDLNLTGSLYNNNNAIEQWLYNSNMDTYYNSGNIGIGTNNPNYLLDINGDIKANTFIDVSDIRLKEEIEDDTLSIEFINSLTPKSYTYINNNKIRHGLIAQELLSLGYSNFVNKDSDGYYTIHMISLLGPMINSLKDLSNKNEILKNKLLLLKK